MGKTIIMSEDAYKKIVPDYTPSGASIILNNDKNLDAVVSALNQKYKTAGGGVSFSNDKTNFKSIFKLIQMAMGLASMLIILLTFAFIACITILLCTITIYREVTDTGIFKAIGFKNIELRLQFTFRFVLISVIGSAIGLTISLLFDDKISKVMFASAGIATITPTWDLMSVGFPFLFVVCVTGITAFVSSLKIKKVLPVTLINE
jgi:putative ABC transport system permease protein